MEDLTNSPNRITCYYNGFALLVYREVAEQFNLKDSHLIKDESFFMKIIFANQAFILQENIKQINPHSIKRVISDN